MAAILTDGQREILSDKNFAHLATTNKDGSPQVSPVWVEYDGALVILNSEKTRLKVRNIQRDPRVALSVLDAHNPYRYVEIRGRVTEITEQGANEHIDKLAKKYLGKDKYPFHQDGDVRVILKIEPSRVTGMGA